MDTRTESEGPVLILAGPDYEQSIWCQKMIGALVARLKYKRMPWRQLTALGAAEPGSRYIYLLGSDGGWIEAALQAANAAALHPVLLCNQAYHAYDANYSTVCMDIVGSMSRVLSLLRQSGRQRVALYGVNRLSVSDESRRQGYLAVCGAGGEQDVFYNDGSMQDCFAAFMPRLAEYDAVVCVNELGAVSLVRGLARAGRGPQNAPCVVSCADGLLARRYADRMKIVHSSAAARARAAVTLVESLEKNPELSHIIMTISEDFSDLAPAAPCKAAAGAPRPEPLPEIQDVFYDDPELAEMMRVERLLYGADETDRQLLDRLMAGQPLARIAADCFLTESAVKYRLKKLTALCGAKDRSALRALLREYLPRGAQ